MFTSLSTERRRFVCEVCGQERVVVTKPIEKWVLVCVHPDSRGSVLPVMQLREQGKRILD